MEIELLISNKYIPAVKEGIIWTTERSGSPGKLVFSVYKDGILIIESGNTVNLKVDGVAVFYGYIFSLSHSRDDFIDVVAYDQIRYLKFKDTYVYSNKTASDVVRMIANDRNMELGTVDSANYIIPYRIEDNKTLIDIICNAIFLEMQHTGKVFVFYDDYGKLCFRNAENLQLDLLIDDETAGDYSLKRSIDSQTYNRIKLIHDQSKDGRVFHEIQDDTTVNKWGILQYSGKYSDNENQYNKAAVLLKLYNKETNTLTVKNALGDLRVRAGKMIYISDVKKTKGVSFMIEKCIHNWKEEEHFMDLTLSGGWL